MTSSDQMPKIIIDCVHGDIRPNEREWQVIDTASFQRLRHIKQLAMAHVTYPNAVHTRFSHSLGTFHIMCRILPAIGRKIGGRKVTKRDKDNLRLAALLHDIGHYPYSHLMEDLNDVILTEELVGDSKTVDQSRDRYPSHDEVGRLIATKQKDLVNAIGSPKRARVVADIFTRSATSDPQLSKLIHSSLDVDRLDYLLRDSDATGVPYGQVDINYILNNVRLSPDGLLGVEPKALPAVDHFLLARYFMHRAVYYHKTTLGFETACRHLLRRIRDKPIAGNNKYKIPRDGEAVRSLVCSSELGTFTDAFVDGLVQEAANDQEDEGICLLAKTIQSRTPPKLIMGVDVFEEYPDSHHRGTTFKQNCIHGLAQVCEDISIPLPQVLFWETKPVRFEARPAMVRASDAHALEPEESDELVKVFRLGQDEPRSLVELDSESIVARCSNLSYRAYRLYVVLGGDVTGESIAELRERASGWTEVP